MVFEHNEFMFALPPVSINMFQLKPSAFRRCSRVKKINDSASVEPSSMPWPNGYKKKIECNFHKSNRDHKIHLC